MPPRNKAKSKAKPSSVQKRSEQQQMRAPIAPPLEGRQQRQQMPPLDNYSAPMQQPQQSNQQLQQAMMEAMRRKQ